MRDFFGDTVPHSPLCPSLLNPAFGCWCDRLNAIDETNTHDQHDHEEPTDDTGH